MVRAGRRPIGALIQRFLICAMARAGAIRHQMTRSACGGGNERRLPRARHTGSFRVVRGRDGLGGGRRCVESAACDQPLDRRHAGSVSASLRGSAQRASRRLYPRIVAATRTRSHAFREGRAARPLTMREAVVNLPHRCWREGVRPGSHRAAEDRSDEPAGSRQRDSPQIDRDPWRIVRTNANGGGWPSAARQRLMFGEDQAGWRFSAHRHDGAVARSSAGIISRST